MLQKVASEIASKAVFDPAGNLSQEQSTNLNERVSNVLDALLWTIDDSLYVLDINSA